MAFNTLKNYYEILGVSIDSTNAEIKSAYRKLARKYHPDINKDSNAIEIFKDVTEAYETLSNPQKREQYNIIKGLFKTEAKTFPQQANDEYKTKGSENSSNTSAKEEAPKSTTVHAKRYKYNDGNSVLKNIKFWFLKFKKNKRVRDSYKPKKGDNITTDITITPDEVLTGSKRIINIRSTQTCPNCNGHKFINSGKCPKCEGKGSITLTKKLTVTIPKGIKDGAKLRIKGEGYSGKNGGANGDLYINIRVETKTQIHFDKLNIYYNVPITPFEAALGEEITIPTFDGKIKLKLPKNTSSGQKFRIAKQGIKKNGKIGDLIISVTIEFSHDLSDDEIKLYEKLKNLSKDNVRKNFGYGN